MVGRDGNDYDLARRIKIIEHSISAQIRQDDRRPEVINDKLDEERQTDEVEVVEFPVSQVPVDQQLDALQTENLKVNACHIVKGLDKAETIISLLENVRQIKELETHWLQSLARVEKPFLYLAFRHPYF